MKKTIVLIVSVVAVLSFIAVEDSEALSSYGVAVNDFCIETDPYPDRDCLFCHTSNSKSEFTDEMDAYVQDNLCYFCPGDSACTTPTCTDADLDGFYAEPGCGPVVDCNDRDPSMNPNEFEICDDGKDNDCNGAIDLQDTACGVLACTDNDGDGFSIEGGDCGPADCIDSDATIYPGAADICSDGIDQDCSGKDRTKGKGCKTTTGGREGKGRTCSDGLDNDGDGLWDCQDPGCSKNRACR